MSVNLCYIRKSFFDDHIDYIKLLDVGNTNKQSHRTHLCLAIENNSNMFYIPLRNNLGDEVRKYGRIGHSLPSASRAAAGLDYRYTLIVNDIKYIEVVKDRNIPKRQYEKLEHDYQKIIKEFETYLNGYIKAAKRGRAQSIPLYRESSLVNFHEELRVV